jgi:bifunctional ADP-heptose synthase (sugar kinase/adenylyltransferase)/phosphoglycolate phosphatase-like HAD superfamily hydrolase
MSTTDFKNIFSSFVQLKVGVIGDFAVDVYYDFNKTTGEISIETGKPVHRGSGIRTSLGGAGNIVHNLKALGVATIYPFSLIGDDLFGLEMLHLLQQLDVHTNFVKQVPTLDTCAYVKPMMGKEEDYRIDFGTTNQIINESRRTLMESLAQVVKVLDVLIINRQLPVPLIGDDEIVWLNKLAKENPHCQFFADMRSGGEKLQGITLKVNTDEAAHILNQPAIDKQDTQECIIQAKAVAAKTQSAVLMTRGENGMIYVKNGEVEKVDGVWVTGEVDTVGAGDTSVSTFATCMGAKTPSAISLEIANLAAAVTVKKLFQTGTANPKEIMELRKDCNYIHNNHLAYAQRKANYWEDSDIELVEPIDFQRFSIEHVIMDHDGTISTLREGWEAVMHPVMLECICGDQLSQISQKEYDRIAAKALRFIDETTGIQTIVQMQGLVDMIREEGLIPAAEVKTAAEYKAIYLDRLMESVDDRLARFEKGERSLTDFTMLGAESFLKILNQQGIHLYLASGTDEENVKIEANALGYGSLISGGIFGSKGNEIGDAKRQVIQRILSESQCKGENLLVIGDGPVEIQEGRRAGALCIGIASDEVRRYGLNPSKRTRLIRAGAHLIIPDFAQLEQLINLIFESQKVGGGQ